MGYVNLRPTVEPVRSKLDVSRSRLAGKAIYFVTRAKILEEAADQPLFRGTKAEEKKSEEKRQKGE